MLSRPSVRYQLVSFPLTFSSVYGVYTGFGSDDDIDWKPSQYPTVANRLTNSSVYIANNDGTRVEYYWIAIGKA